MSTSPIRLLKPREMFRTITLTGFAALVAATSDLACAARARADRQDLFRSAAAAARQYSARRSRSRRPTTRRKCRSCREGRVLPAPTGRRRGRGSAAGSVQSQPLAPPPGTTVIPQNAPPARRRRAAAGRRAPPGAGNQVCRAWLPGSVSRRARRSRRPPCSPATRSSPSRRRRRSSTRRRASPVSTRSPGASSISTRISARPSSSARCGSRPTPATRVPATEAANTDAFVEVDEITLQGEVKRIFSGWMFAASPGLHGVEHPIYDIWLTDCKGPETTVVTRGARSAEACGAAAAAGAEAAPSPKQAAPRPPGSFRLRRNSRPNSSLRHRRRSNPAGCSGFSDRDYPRPAMIASASAPAIACSIGSLEKSAGSPLIALSSSAV